MVKGIMAKLGDDLIDGGISPGQAIFKAPPLNLPNVNINLDSGVHIAQHVESIMRVMNPELYAPVPAPVDTKDKYGTPLEWMQMPDTIDKREQEMSFRNRLVASPMSMLCMRMKWGPFNEVAAGFGEDPSPPFEHLSIHLGTEKAIVFIVSAGEAVTIHDDINIFPSDSLITQLRMLVERNPTAPRT